MPSAWWGQGGTTSPFPLVKAQGHNPLPHPGGQWRIPGAQMGAGAGGGRVAQAAHTRVRTPGGRCWGLGRGQLRRPPGLSDPPTPTPVARAPTAAGPQPAPSTDDPAQNQQGPGWSQGHSSRAIATAQETGPCRRRRVNKRYRGGPPRTPPLPAPEYRPRVPGPGAWGGRTIPGASSAASPGAGPAPLCPQDRSLGRGPSEESWGRARGPGDRASLPRAEVSARGTGGAGAGGFISPGGVRLLTEPARCTAPLQYGNAVPAGGARLRGAQGYGDHGPADARGRDGNAKGGCGEDASYKGAEMRRAREGRREGAQAERK